MNFDEIVKKVETLDGLTLDQLFELWKDAQKAEKGWEKTTVPVDGGRLMDHFTEDGIIDPQAYDKAECKILVVLKEANIAENKEDAFYLKKDDHRVWYNEFVNGEYNASSRKVMYRNEIADNNSCQKQLIGRMSYLLQQYWRDATCSGSIPTVKQIQDALKKTTVMNLNKRGGGKALKKRIFKNYCKKYAVFIKKEIELINPDIIVWCVPEIANPKQVFEIPLDKVIIPMIHPAGAIYIRNNNPDLLLKGTELNVFCDKLWNMDKNEYMDCRRSVVKYMLIFKTRAIKAIDSGKLKL